ncbi:MAG: TatD family hydrolase [Minisyncoccota bacterium]
MNTRYIDAHCHLQFEQYDADREEIIEQMRERGVAGVVVGVSYDAYGSSKAAVDLAEKHEHLFASVGLHPGDAVHGSFDEEAFLALAKHPKVVAIGECGLEYFHKEASAEEKKAQKELFKKHIALAAELDKPLIIHARPSSAKATEGKPSYDAYRDIIELLKEAKVKYPSLSGDMHFFAGGAEEAEAFIKLGFTISFTAVITFARDYDAVIRAIPLENILAETDAPFVAPASRRGQRNDPLAVIDVAAKIAEIRGEDPEIVRQALLANTRRLYGL